MTHQSDFFFFSQSPISQLLLTLLPSFLIPLDRCQPLCSSSSKLHCSTVQLQLLLRLAPRFSTNTFHEVVRLLCIYVAYFKKKADSATYNERCAGRSALA